MNISAVQSQSLGQYITLLSNPLFLNAVKSAAKSNDKNGKYDGLFENLEKLSKLLAKDNGNGVSKTSTDNSSPLSPLSSLTGTGAGTGTSQTQDAAQIKHQMENDALGQIVDDLIAKADLMESLLDLEIIPPDEELISLFKKFRDIITQLDKDTRQLHKEVKDREVKTELKLRPDASTKSGFQEGLTLLAQ